MELLSDDLDTCHDAQDIFMDHIHPLIIVVKLGRS